MRLLHTMLRVGDLQRSIDFYTRVMGMRLLRTTERPEQGYSLAFVGYGSNPEQAEIELTYNHGVSSYELGTAYGVIDFFDDRHGGADADIARRREGHPASPAVENRGAYFLFEAADLTGERWLCQIQSLRCSYESLFFGYRNECLELSQVH